MPDEEIQITDFKSGANKNAYTVKSLWYKGNTAIILIDANVMNKGKILSHEGGHAEYNIKNMAHYQKWLINNPGKSDGGHGGGNPSGEAAYREQEVYRKNEHNAK